MKISSQKHLVADGSVVEVVVHANLGCANHSNVATSCEEEFVAIRATLKARRDLDL